VINNRCTAISNNLGLIRAMIMQINTSVFLHLLGLPKKYFVQGLFMISPHGKGLR